MSMSSDTPAPEPDDTHLVGELSARLPIERLQDLLFSARSNGNTDRAETAVGEASVEHNYELLEELGCGQYGRVFRARDLALQRDVAVKLCTDPRLERIPAVRALSLHEARALARIDHPHVVHINTIDEVDGQLYMNLELIEGRTLRDIVTQDGPLSPEEAARVGAELADAVACLHGQGLLHRDIKHSNVMLEDGGRTVLLDFGFSRGGVEREEATQELAGSPLFMAPEQLEGSDPSSPSTDLYSMGVLLYYLVSGSYPVVVKDVASLMRRADREAAFRPLAQVRPDLPPAFLDIVARTVDPDPTNRPESAAALAADLRSFLAGRTSRKVARQRALWFTGIMAASALALLGWWGDPAQDAVTSVVAYATRDNLRVPLDDGDVVRLNEVLTIEVSLPGPRWVYLVNQDVAGNAVLLFPLAGYDLENPLTGPAMHALPGTRDGEPLPYEFQVPSGGREGLLLLSCSEPLLALEERLAETTMSAEALALDAGLLDQVLRGVGVGLHPRPVENAPDPESAFPLLDELEDRARGLDAGIEVWRLNLVGTDS